MTQLLRAPSEIPEAPGRLLRAGKTYLQPLAFLPGSLGGSRSRTLRLPSSSVRLVQSGGASPSSQAKLSALSLGPKEMLARPPVCPSGLGASPPPSQRGPVKFFLLC